MISDTIGINHYVDILCYVLIQFTSVKKKIIWVTDKNQQSKINTRSHKSIKSNLKILLLFLIQHNFSYKYQPHFRSTNTYTVIIFVSLNEHYSNKTQRFNTPTACNWAHSCISSVHVPYSLLTFYLLYGLWRVCFPRGYPSKYFKYPLISHPHLSYMTSPT